ncbi:ISN1-domain-containing protein, partial [Metschnikowia bicuspidata]
TAAGYPGHQGALSYQSRLEGLIETLRTTTGLSDRQKNNFLVMGSESNYLFRFDSSKGELRFIDGKEWYLPLMRNWDQSKIVEVIDVCHEHLLHLQHKFRLEDDHKTKIIRKERSLGIIPMGEYKISREILEEIVLSVLARLNEVLHLQKPQAIHLFNKTNEQIPVDQGSLNDSEIRACAFNGSSDVWVDIGDKSLGVAALQQYLYTTSTRKDKTLVSSSQSLHIGDQFASVGANDFKARLSACTVWISSPRETQEILEDLIGYLKETTDDC